ncbi:hypothetical protein PROFUN_16418, partial [Planoprotostelium fungivorum]
SQKTQLGISPSTLPRKTAQILMLQRGRQCGLSHKDIKWSQPHWTYSGHSHRGHKVVLFVSTSPKTVPGSPTDLCSINLYSIF